MNTKIQHIADKLTHDQIVYLHIVNEIWGGSEALTDQYIEDVEDTGGEFGDDNWIALDYIDSDFDNDHVKEVINKWKNLHDNEGEYKEDYSSLDILDEVLYEGAFIDDFQNVKISISGETGSLDWEIRNDDEEIEVIDILQHVDVFNIVNDFLIG